MSDYIRRADLIEALENLVWYQPVGKCRLSAGAPGQEKAVYKADDVYNAVNNLPAADVIGMPKGKPGDYLLWDTGRGYYCLYGIEAVCICRKGVRYDLGTISPLDNSPNIVKIMSREEAEKVLRGEEHEAD